MPCRKTRALARLWAFIVLTANVSHLVQSELVSVDKIALANGEASPSPLAGPPTLGTSAMVDRGGSNIVDGSDEDNQDQKPLETTMKHQIQVQASPFVAPPSDFPADEWGNTIPDFSQVGYRNGNVPLPQVPVKVTLQPSVDPRINDRDRIQEAIDFVGRLPLTQLLLRDGKTTVSVRGAVLLQAGIYHVNGALILNKSGVVLRGEGNGPDGTIVMATGRYKHDFIYLHGLLDSTFQGAPEYQAQYGDNRVMRPKNPYVIMDEKVAQVEDVYVPVGSRRVPVKDISNFSVGKEVVIERIANSAWVERLGMDRIPKRPLDPSRTMNWDSRQYELRYVRKITAIETLRRRSSIKEEVDTNQDGTLLKRSWIMRNRTSNPRPAQAPLLVDLPLHDATGAPPTSKASIPSSEGELGPRGGAKVDDDEDDYNVSNTKVPGYLILDIPLVMNIDPVYGSGVVYNFERETKIPSDVGLENLALWSDHDLKNAEDEHHGWFAVQIDHCQHCWVTDVKAKNFVSGIKASPGSKHITIQDCEIRDPISKPTEGGRRYMYMLQGQMGLVKRCTASDSRHDFMTGAKTPGPNVFVDSEGVRANNDAGPHDRWATGILYDNIKSTWLNVRNRGWMGSGQGWSGAFHVVYRCSTDEPSEFQSPPGATNWVIDFQGELGNQGVDFDGDDATILDVDAADQGKVPRSLYWSQLVARLGGDEARANRIEKLVGAAGKNVYPSPKPRAFMTEAQIQAASNMLKLMEAKAVARLRMTKAARRGH
ncbi:hypothetical protein BGW38_009664 [Lunasporangiospora selenospora]|uniref:Right handed beta helix region n=1 Tax=Lunasporangiospora selenospora TaxID=979761 RepID=A0A9P6FYC1_9FUNG|nr:hypothetical protein BGW38_009664 [Lunasporangiospora selenospora]